MIVHSQLAHFYTGETYYLDGGSDGTGVVYDTGSVWVTVNGVQKSVSYGQGSTATTVATALRDAINADGSYPVTASLSGATLTLTAKANGAITNYSLAKGSTTSQPGTFPGPSFSVAVSGAALTGGSDGQQSVVKFHHHDHLSMRVSTDSGGNIVAQSGHYPYGESWYEAGGANKLKFTSYERDFESGNDYAMFRFHVNRLGRFSSPDRLAGSITDPQSLNLFSYVGNSPINSTDPLGLFAVSAEDQFWFLTRGLTGGGGGGGGWGPGWQIGAS